MLGRASRPTRVLRRTRESLYPISISITDDDHDEQRGNKADLWRTLWVGGGGRREDGWGIQILSPFSI